MGKPNNVDTSGRPPVNVSSRIPSTLQAVFLASNRGNVVNTPPPRQVAFKTFRSWFGRTFATDSKNRKSCKGEVPTKTVVCKTLQPELLVSKDVQSEPLESKAANSPKKKKVR